MQVAALDDRALLAAMRSGDAYAWSEFDARFRPALTAYAGRVRLSPGLTDADVADALVDDLLAEEGARLTAPNASEVPALGAYLLRAARHRLFNLRRAATRRLRRYDEAATREAGGDVGYERVVVALCSENALRESGGDTMRSAPEARTCRGERSTTMHHDGESPRDASVDTSTGTGAVSRLAEALRATTTIEEQQLLGWVAQRVPHRVIAGWLHVSYEATTKRIWRLCRRLRAAAVRYACGVSSHERAEIERFLRRSGALPPVIASSTALRSVAGGDVVPVDHDD
jgi:hypothetical protein